MLHSSYLTNESAVAKHCGAVEADTIEKTGEIRKARRVGINVINKEVNYVSVS